MPSIDGLEYELVDGEGTPLVFLHGWLGSRDSWKEVRKELDIDNPLLFYDQRCHGESNCEKFDFTELAEDLDNLMDELGLEKPVLVGHSMGGMVALTYTANHDNFSGLMLFGACASTPEPRIKDNKFYLENFDSMDREDWAEMISRNYAEETDHPEIADEARRQLANAPEETILYGLMSMEDYDIRGDLTSIDTPAVVVAGSRDDAIQEHMTRELAELLGCERITLDATHLMLQEVPSEVAEITQNFTKTEVK